MERLKIPSQDVTGQCPGDIETDFGAMARQLTEVYCEEFWPEGRTAPPMGGSRWRPFQVVSHRDEEPSEDVPSVEVEEEMPVSSMPGAWRDTRFGEWPDEVSEAFIPKEALLHRPGCSPQVTMPSR